MGQAGEMDQTSITIPLGCATYNVIFGQFGLQPREEQCAESFIAGDVEFHNACCTTDLCNPDTAVVLGGEVLVPSLSDVQGGGRVGGLLCVAVVVAAAMFG